MHRYGLKELSLKIGRNHSYLQQYVTRGSPRTLPEVERVALARLLALDPNELRDPDERAREVEALTAPAGAAPVAGLIGIRQVPVRIEGALRSPSGSTLSLAEFIHPPPSADAFALRLTETHGLLQPGAMLLVDPRVRPRMGDLAALIDHERIRAIGLATLAPARRIALVTPDGETISAEAEEGVVELWRIDAIKPG